MRTSKLTKLEPKTKISPSINPNFLLQFGIKVRQRLYSEGKFIDNKMKINLIIASTIGSEAMFNMLWFCIVLHFCRSVHEKEQ